MRDSKLYQWLTKLSTQEQNEFLRYTSYMGGRNRDELGGILELILLKVVRGSALTREEFWAEWRGDEPFDPNRFNKRLSELKGLLDEFLAVQVVRQNPVTKAALLSEALKKRDMVEFARSERSEALKALEREPIQFDHSLRLLQIEENYLEIALTSPRSSKRMDAPIYQELMRHSEQFYLALMLRYACAAHDQDRIFGTTHDYGTLPIIMHWIERDLARCHIVVRLYYQSYLIQNNPGDQALFEALLRELSAARDLLEPIMLRDLYRLAMNHCVRRINLGEHAYDSILADVYSELQQTGVLIRDGQMGVGELKNIISNTVRSGKIALAYELLDSYGQYLAPENDWAYDYNRAVIDYHQAVAQLDGIGREGTQAERRSILAELMRIRKVFYGLIGKSDDIFYDIDSKVHYLRVSNELGEFDMFEIQFEPLRVFLGRKKGISTEHKENYRQFIYHLKDLCRIRTDQSLSRHQQREKLQKLEAKLQEAKDIANLEWLRKKIKEALDK